MQRYIKNIYNSAIREIFFCKKLFIISFFSLLTLSARSNPNRTVVVRENNPTIANVFRVIEEQTGIRFAYDASLDTSKRVNVPQAPTPLSEMLAITLKDTGWRFEISSKFIAIKKEYGQEKENIESGLSSIIYEPQNFEWSDQDNQVQQLSGTVLDDVTKQPVKGASVELSGAGKTSTDDIYGRFVYDNVPVGNCKITVSFEGYKPAELYVVVSSDNLRQLTITLKPVATTTVAQHADTSRATAKTSNSAIPGLSTPEQVKTPSIAIKSNLLYDATATINLGAEFKLNNKMTLDLPVSYNPWSFGGYTKWKHLLVQPELRWWSCKPFSGHFFGLHAHYAIYSIGALPDPPFSNYMHTHMFEGWLAGAGISYGYHKVLNKRWAMEATAGAGYAYLDYQKYRCVSCGGKLGKEHKNYFGPTKAGISLIYMIK